VHRDLMTPRGFASNHAGGILGGISTGSRWPRSRSSRPPACACRVLRGRGRQRDRRGHHRPPRPLRGHPRHADRRGDDGAGADGPGAAPPRAVRRRRRDGPAHSSAASRTPA
jgi:chorismate synthase